MLCFALGPYDDYVGAEQCGLTAVADRTLHAVFSHVLWIPGERVFALASDGPLTTAIAERLASRHIATQLVNPHYLCAVLTPDRLGDMRRAASGEAPLNRDFHPALYYRHLLLWMSQFQVRFGLLEAALAAIMVIYLARIRPVPLAVFTTGFAASAMVVVLLAGFQILYGSAYRQLSVIVTMFMAGLAIGSFVAGRWLAGKSCRRLAALQLAIALAAMGIPPLLAGLGRLDPSVAGSLALRAAIPLATMGLATLVGLQFAWASQIDYQSTAQQLLPSPADHAAHGARRGAGGEGGRRQNTELFSA